MRRILLSSHEELLELSYEIGRSAYCRGLDRLPELDNELSVSVIRLLEAGDYTSGYFNEWRRGWDDSSELFEYEGAILFTHEEKLDNSYELGKCAYANGLDRVPGLDRVFLADIVSGLPVGSGVVDYFNAWLNGWDTLNLENVED